MNEREVAKNWLVVISIITILFSGFLIYKLVFDLTPEQIKAREEARQLRAQVELQTQIEREKAKIEIEKGRLEIEKQRALIPVRPATAEDIDANSISVGEYVGIRTVEYVAPVIIRELLSW